MNKRVFLAIALSFSVLFFWQNILKSIYHIDNKEVRDITSQRETKQELPEEPISQSAVLDKLDFSPLEKIETDKLILELVNPGARIQRVYLKDYKLDTQITGAVFSKSFEDKLYTLQRTDGNLQLIAEENGHSVIQNINFRNNNYTIELETIYDNKSSSNWTLNDKLILNSILDNSHPEEKRLFEVVFLNQETKRKNPSGIKNKYVHNEAFRAMGFRDRYSCIIINPSLDSARDKQSIMSKNPQIKGYIEKYNKSTEIGLDLGTINVPANSRVVLKSIIYCGPQDISLLKQSRLGFEGIVHYGSFDFISSALLSILRLFHHLSRNWGAAIILLSVFVFFFLYPLTVKQMRSMKQMQALQPHIEALRKTYKDNPQRMQKETMELYRRHKANPFGGCLPVILQIPIFIGLFQALSRSIVLKGSQFLWIKDLAEADKLFVLASPLPLIGREINLLPVLMAVAMLFQQKLSLKAGAASPEALQQQKMMTLMMPVMFCFIFYKMPSGLSLYYLVNTLLNTLLQWKTLKAAAPAQAPTFQPGQAR
jgi:YidC/Oxa1 family membrane protein insertase